MLGACSTARHSTARHSTDQHCQLQGASSGPDPDAHAALRTFERNADTTVAVVPAASMAPCMATSSVGIEEERNHTSMGQCNQANQAGQRGFAGEALVGIGAQGLHPHLSHDMRPPAAAPALATLSNQKSAAAGLPFGGLTCLGCATTAFAHVCIEGQQSIPA
jgi:hypothetical protein